MTRRCWMLARASMVALAGACGTTPPADLPATPKSATSARAPHESPSASASAPAAASGAPVAAPAVPHDDEEDGVDNLAGIIDVDGPAAPCDLDRPYRGAVGDDAVSVVLTRSGSTLRGFSAYDRGFGEVEVVGSVDGGGRIALTEKKDGKDVGTFRGTCASDSGAIAGSWKQGSVERTFRLRPRDKGGVPLVQRVKRIGTPVEGAPSCHWDVKSPAVFGLGDADRAARINGWLRVRFGSNEAEMERQVTRCERGADRHALGWYSIEANTNGVLSVVENGYTYFGPAVHGDFTAAASAVSIDVPTGSKIALGDLVTSAKALRPVVKACMTLAADAIGSGGEWWWEREIQGVPADKSGNEVDESSPAFVPASLHEPSFLVLPDGIAVLIRNQPTVSAAFELHGPVLRWGALLRAKVLKPKSIVARLWANEKPLAPDEPACVRFFAPKWARKVAKGK